MLLKSIEDVGATLSWCPTTSRSTEALIAVGTKEVIGSGFDDYGASLELHSLDVSSKLQDNKDKALAKGRSTARFASLTWSWHRSEALPLGLIAGGMSDGSVDVWDPSKLLAGHPKAMVSKVQRHSGAVNGLEFNPHASSSHLVASGGADGEVFVVALDTPEKPNVFVPAPPSGNSNGNGKKSSGEITRVAWNSQVSHILATAATNGSCVVWDLRQKRPWCELRDASKDAVSDVCWNPSEGLHIATAAGDDSANPVVRLWDLRSSTTMPLGTLRGHEQGILSASWCRDDTSLLATCARDNKTFVWDLYSMTKVYELPDVGATGDDNGAQQDPSTSFGGTAGGLRDGGLGAAQSTTEAFFGGSDGSGLVPGKGPPGSISSDRNRFGGGTSMGFGSAGRRYQVSWSPTLRATLGACSFDRSVRIFDLGGAPLTLHRRAPAWLKRKAGATFGFGGALASFGEKQGAVVSLQNVVVDKTLVERSTAFERSLEETSAGQQSYVDLCRLKVRQAGEPRAKDVWEFMRLIFEPNAREQLLKTLGYEPKTTRGQENSPQSHQEAPTDVKEENGQPIGAENRASAADFFGAAPPPLANKESIEEDAETVVVDKVPCPQQPGMDDRTSALVKQALLVGDFNGAVDRCLGAGQLADALLVASCGGAELWEHTRKRYFDAASRSGERPFLDIVAAIITNELGELVAKSRLDEWRETLAVVATYGKADEFAGLCELLANRLQKERKDDHAAALCYMCAVNIPKTVDFWVRELYTSEEDTNSLQELVERVAVFARDPDAPPNAPIDLDAAAQAAPALATVFQAYASILAAQGQLAIAAKYCRGDQGPSNMLLHRLQFAGGASSGTARRFPFELRQLGPSPAITGKQITLKQQQDPAAQEQQRQRQVQPQQPGFAIQQQLEQQPARQGPQQQQQQVPPPWLAVVDPSSGRTYYANPQTGHTQWDPPMASAPEPVKMQRPQQQSQPQSASFHPQPQPQSQPTSLQQQQHPASFHHQSQRQPGMYHHDRSQHPGTQPMPQSSPHQRTPMSQLQTQPVGLQQGLPSPAQQQSSLPAHPQPQQPAQPTATGTPSPAPPVVEKPQPPANPAAVRAIQDGFTQLRSALDTCQLNGSEKRQLVEIDKALAKLRSKLDANAVDDDVLNRLTTFVDSLQKRDFTSATREQVALVNSDWSIHKDWLKGVKFLVQLVTKKM